MPRSRAPVTNHSGSIFCIHHINGVPFWKSRNKGGSPSGDNRPPQLATIAMKKSTVCTLYLRCWIVESNRRMSNIAAPVVPMNDASTQPIARMMVFVCGVALRSPRIQIPPVVTKSAISNKINGT